MALEIYSREITKRWRLKEIHWQLTTSTEASRGINTEQKSILMKTCKIKRLVVKYTRMTNMEAITSTTFLILLRKTVLKFFLILMKTLTQCITKKRTCHMLRSLQIIFQSTKLLLDNNMSLFLLLLRKSTINKLPWTTIHLKQPQQSTTNNTKLKKNSTQLKTKEEWMIFYCNTTTRELTKMLSDLNFQLPTTMNNMCRSITITGSNSNSNINNQSKSHQWTTIREPCKWRSSIKLPWCKSSMQNKIKMNDWDSQWRSSSISKTNSIKYRSLRLPPLLRK